MITLPSSLSCLSYRLLSIISTPVRLPLPSSPLSFPTSVSPPTSIHYHCWLRLIPSHHVLLSPLPSVRDVYPPSLCQPIILGCVLLFNEFLHVGELYCMREDRCSRRDTDCGRVAPRHEFSTLHTLCHLAVMNVCEKLYLRCVLPDWSILLPPCTVCTLLQFILHELSPFLLLPYPFFPSSTF